MSFDPVGFVTDLVAGAPAGLFESPNRSGERQQREMFAANVELQREFAKNGIQWRVEDARKAGLSPLAALGSGGASFSPVSVGSVAPDFDSTVPYLGQMGQNISRAVRATASEKTRQELEMGELQLDNMRLDNQLLQMRINQMSQIGPPVPTEPRVMPDTGYTKTLGGGLAPVPSHDFADRAEDQWAAQIAWTVRNMFMPSNPPQSPGAGKYWSWNTFRNEFNPMDIPKKSGWGTGRGYWFNRFRQWLHDKTSRKGQ